MATLANLNGIMHSPRVLFPLAIAILIPVYRDYGIWYSLGPAGVPHNIFGYLLDVFLRVYVAGKHRDRRSVDVYSEKTRFLEDLPVRTGDRPVLWHYVVPHRQVDGNSAEMKEKQTTLLQSFTGDSLYIGISRQERHGPALFAGGKEVAHLHVSDGSAHTTLSQADAREVVEKAWGERHGLSGCGFPGQPLGFTMVYAPRDDEELEVVRRIFQAAVDQSY